MAKQTSIRIAYNECKRFKQVRHYQNENEALQTGLLTSTINISKDREFNKSKGVAYWLKLREAKKWSNVISGLKITNKKYLYYGDIATVRNGVHKPTHLLIFIFSEKGTRLVIYLYKNFYPKNDAELQNALSKYR